MSWIAEQHVCNIPVYAPKDEVWLGRIWECDGCKNTWMVNAFERADDDHMKVWFVCVLPDQATVKKMQRVWTSDM